jgi:hypothetical protein
VYTSYLRIHRTAPLARTSCNTSVSVHEHRKHTTVTRTRHHSQLAAPRIARITLALVHAHCTIWNRRAMCKRSGHNELVHMVDVAVLKINREITLKESDVSAKRFSVGCSLTVNVVSIQSRNMCACVSTTASVTALLAASTATSKTSSLEVGLFEILEVDMVSDVCVVHSLLVLNGLQ